MRILIVSSDRTASGGYAINTGDALLTDALAARLREHGHQVTVGDFGAQRVNADYPRTHIGGIRDLLRTVRRHDSVILGGGTLIQQDSKNLLRGSLMRLCVAVSMSGWLCRVPVVYFAVGCDPLPSRLARAGYRLALSRRSVWLRDFRSAERFEEYFGYSPRVGADAALLLNLVPTSGSLDARALLAAPNRRDGEDLSEAWSAEMLRSFRTIRMMPMSSGEIDDLELVPTNPYDEVSFASTAEGWRDVVHQFEESTCVIASRMHALYIALLLDIPMVAVGESAKIISFADEFKIPRIERFGDFVPGIERRAASTAREKAAERADQAFRQLVAPLAGASRT